MPRRGKKSGKKGGKRATDTMPSTDGGHAHEKASSVEEAADATTQALPTLAGSVGRVLSMRETKDRMLVKAGLERVPSTNPMFRMPVPLIELSKRLRLNVIGPDGNSVARDNVSILRHKIAKHAYAIIKQRERQWNTSVCDLVFLSEEQNDHLECSRLATALLDDIDRALSDCISLGDNKLVFILFQHLVARTYRSKARLEFKDFHGSIEDATEGITMLGALEGQDSLFMHMLLSTRAHSLHLAGELEDAEVDSRAVCALLRSFARMYVNRSDQESHLDSCTELLLKVMAARKMKDKVRRPHYTQKQRERIEKELRIGAYMYSGVDTAAWDAG